MLTHSVRTLAFSSVAIVLLTGCSAVQLPEGVEPSASRPMIVHVTNDSQEMVNVFFQSDSNRRVRIGTMSAKTEASFFPRLLTTGPGHFYARRLGSADPAVALGGTVDPHRVRTGIVLITIGPVPEFDHWSVRD